MFHLARNGAFAFCGFYVDNSHPKRRRDDWRLASNAPQLPYGLCGKCQRVENGEPEPEIEWRAFSSRHLMHTLP